jgi:hypothetical protein
MRRGKQGQPTRQLRLGQLVRQFEDRERIAARLRHQAIADPLVQPAGHHRREQRVRVLVREPPEHKLGQADQLALVSRVADREHKRHRLGQQPSRHEAQHLPRGNVEPLRVVDEAQQRPLGGHLGQEAKRGQADQETVRSRARGQAQRDTQGRPLRLRKSLQPPEHRRAELVQARERQLHLGLHAGDPRHPEAGRLARAMVQQRRLADPSLPPHDQDRALAAADVLQQPIERSTLVDAAQKHRRPARGHP